MAAAEVVQSSEHLHDNHSSCFYPRKNVDELDLKVADRTADCSTVHLIFNDSKKSVPNCEVNMQPEKIVEVYRLQDGSQSFRVRWKDTWIHEQFISAYQHLVNAFWERQKKDLTAESDADKENVFEDMNGDVSSDNDSYSTTMDVLLLEEVNQEKHDTQEHFIDDKATSCDEEFNFSQEKGHSDSSEGNNLQQEHSAQNILCGPNVEVLMQSCESTDLNDSKDKEVHLDAAPCGDISSNDKTDILEPLNGGLLQNQDLDDVIGKLGSGGSLEDMNKNVNNECAVNGNNINHKSSASFKRLGRRVKKKIRLKEEKKVSKRKHMEDEEKENNEEQFNNDMISAQANVCEEDGDQADPALDILPGDKPRKREKFSYPENKGPCKCDICGKLISNKYGLREHQTVVHFKNGKFECQICGKRVTNKRALNLHMTSHSNERRFVCELCGSSHKTKGNLNYHVKTMHTMIKNFRCDICFKTFKVQAELKEHCFSVHANEGVITCIVCKKKLTTALSIYTHSVMHSGAREHECDICGYAFKTLTGLKEHKITHSEDKPVRQCPYCERKFFSRSQYNAHVMRHTADGSLITYKCPICDVKFQHKSSYNRHVIRHQPGGDLEFPKENPYLLLDVSELPDGVCHKCRKHYSSKSGFYLHLKKCRDGIVQQFQCPYCERGCSNRSSLKRHIQRRHKSIDFENQAIREHDIIRKQEVDGVEVTHQGGVLTSQDGIQYHGTYFEHGYGNQITTVDATQLSTVDVQLLLDTAATQNENQSASHILGNISQVSQLAQNSGAAQNLHILTENEAAQFAAQLTEHGVIVRSSDVSRDQDQEQHLIVGTTQIDGRTSQLLVSERQAAQLLASAQLDENSALTLQTSDRGDIIRDANVLQFNNRTAVIQIQHNDVMTTQQVLTIPEQQLRDEPDIHVGPHIEGQTIADIDDANVRVSDLQRSSDIKMECDNDEVQQYVEEEQIVSSLSENDVEHTYQSLSI